MVMRQSDLEPCRSRVAQPQHTAIFPRPRALILRNPAARCWQNCAKV